MPGAPSAPPTPTGPISRIKDIAQLQSARDNQLVGYGLVIGLNSSGDSLRNSPFTEQSIRAMLEISASRPKAARHAPRTSPPSSSPPICRPSCCRARASTSACPRSATPPRSAAARRARRAAEAADGEIYAVAQGPVFISGFSAEGQAEQLTQGVPTAGRVPNGAIIERQVQADFGSLDSLILQLRNPDFSTAVRVADAINTFAVGRDG